MSAVCRACIVRHLQAGPRTCPTCSADVTADPVADVGLQRLVYLVVPGLLRAEQERRRNFRQANPQCSTLSQAPPLGAPELGHDDLVSLSLREMGAADGVASTRYLKCPAGVSVRHLLRLLMLKRGWDDTDGQAQYAGNKIELLYGSAGPEDELRPLRSTWTLIDLASIFDWKRVSGFDLRHGSD